MPALYTLRRVRASTFLAVAAENCTPSPAGRRRSRPRAARGTRRRRLRTVDRPSWVGLASLECEVSRAPEPRFAARPRTGCTVLPPASRCYSAANSPRPDRYSCQDLPRSCPTAWCGRSVVNGDLPVGRVATRAADWRPPMTDEMMSLRTLVEKTSAPPMNLVRSQNRWNQAARGRDEESNYRPALWYPCQR
jgi:hypothetical protein